MGWSSEFVAMLSAQRRSPVYRLVFPTSFSIPGVGLSWTIASHPGYAYDDACFIAPGVRVGGARIVPGSWNYSHGGFSVPVSGSLTNLLQKVTRGSIAVLMVGAAGWRNEQFQPVAIGVLSQIQGKPPAWTLEFWDFMTTLRSRITTTSTSLPLFFNVGQTTTLTSNYTGGGTTLNVADSSIFEKDSDNTFGIVKVEPTTGGGPPFYLGWSAKPTGTTLTVAAVAKLGTTAVNANSGDVLTHCAYIQDSPADIVRKLLVSTGAATNGTYDTLPDDWGYALSEELIDHSDMDEWKNHVILDSTPAVYDWEVLVEEPQENGLQWLQGLLADAGIWMVTRQGQISIRAAQDPVVSSSNSPRFAPTDFGFIKDEHIEVVEDWQAFDSNVAFEAATSNVVTDSSSSGFAELTLATLPGVEAVDHDISDRVFSNEAAIQAGDRARLGPWDLRVPERLVLRCSPWTQAQLVPGDLVYVTSQKVYGRWDVPDEFYSLRPAMVTDVHPDWSGATVRLGMSVPPLSGAEFP